MLMVLFKNLPTQKPGKEDTALLLEAMASFFIIWKKFDNSPDPANEQGSNDLGLSYNIMIWDSATA